MYNGFGIDTAPINTTPTTGSEGFLVGASVVVVILMLLIALILIVFGVLLIVSNCKIFKKAGEDWWKGLIPLYNSWVETKITGLGWWWYLIFVGLTALIQQNDNNVVLYFALFLTSFNYSFNLAKKFGKSNGFAVLCTFLPFIGLPILAFGSAKYEKSAKVDVNGIFSIK